MEHSAILSHATMVRAFVGPLFERFVVVEKAKVYAACPKFPRIIETVKDAVAFSRSDFANNFVDA